MMRSNGCRSAVLMTAALALALSFVYVGGQCGMAQDTETVTNVSVMYVVPLTTARAAVEEQLLPLDLFTSERTVLEQYAWKQKMTLFVGECGPNVSSDYENDSRTIRVCLSDAIGVHNLFVQAGNHDPAAAAYTQNTMVFVLLHELGHALIDQFALPTTGSLEDAADEYAAIIMAGQQNARLPGLEAAYWFQFRASAGLPQPSSWDSHDADARRRSHVACLIFGAFPGEYSVDFKQLGMPPDQEAPCVVLYARQQRIWNYMLTPYTKLTPVPSPRPNGGSYGTCRGDRGNGVGV